jgi:hypothetical protein
LIDKVSIFEAISKVLKDSWKSPLQSEKGTFSGAAVSGGTTCPATARRATADQIISFILSTVSFQSFF